jgi:hypothetical protein
MVHPKIVDLIRDHTSEIGGVPLCEDYCMVCPVKDAVEAYIHPKFKIRDMGNAVTQFLATYRKYKDAAKSNPLGTYDRDEVSSNKDVQYQADPRELYRFLFVKWYEALKNPKRVAK